MFDVFVENSYVFTTGRGSNYQNVPLSFNACIYSVTLVRSTIITVVINDRFDILNKLKNDFSIFIISKRFVAGNDRLQD